MPTTTVALGLVSGIVAVAITSTHALAAYDGRWFHRFSRREFTQTAASVLGITGWYTIAPFFLATVVAVICAALATGKLRVSPSETALAGFAVLDWAVLAAWAPKPAELGGRAEHFGAYGAFGFALLAAVAATFALAGGSRRQAARQRQAA